MLVSSFGNVASSFRRTSAKLRLDEILMCSTESVCDVRLACVAAWVILCSPKRFMRWRSSKSKVSHILVLDITLPSGLDEPQQRSARKARKPTPDRQSVNRDCLRVNQGAHRHSLLGANSWPGCQSW